MCIIQYDLIMQQFFRAPFQSKSFPVMFANLQMSRSNVVQEFAILDEVTVVWNRIVQTYSENIQIAHRIILRIIIRIITIVIHHDIVQSINFRLRYFPTNIVCQAVFLFTILCKSIVYDNKTNNYEIDMFLHTGYFLTMPNKKDRNIASTNNTIRRNRHTFSVSRIHYSNCIT